MLKIAKIKLPKSTLVFQKHHSKSGFESTTKILTINNKEKSTELSKYMWSLNDDQIMSRMRWCQFSKKQMVKHILIFVYYT